MSDVQAFIDSIQPGLDPRRFRAGAGGQYPFGIRGQTPGFGFTDLLTEDPNREIGAAFRTFGKARQLFLPDLEDQLQAARRNPFLQSTLRQVGGLPQTLLGQVQQFQRGALGDVRQLRSDLVSSALGSTLGGAVAGTQAARTASGGRGLAFGGGATEIARRSASQAAVGQGAALAQALSGATQAGIGVRQAAAGMGVQGLLGAGQLSANLAQALQGQELGVRSQFLRSLQSLPIIGLQAAVAPRAPTNRGLSDVGALLGGIGSVLR